MAGRSLGSPPKKLIRPPMAASVQGAFLRGVDRRRDDDHIRAAAAGFLPRCTACRSSCTGFTARSAPMRRAWAARSATGSLTITRPAPRSSGQLGVHHADRPGADHQHDLAGLDVQGILAAQHAGKRLHQRRHGRVDALADLDHVALLHRSGRDAHVFGEAAVHGHPDRPIIGAQVVVAADALARSARSPCWGR